MDDCIYRGDAFDAVMGQYCASSDETEAALNGAIEDIRKIPAADVREVVLCAECRYYSEKRRECGHINGLSEIVFPTDYCSYGSKPMMDGEGNDG